MLGAGLVARNARAARPQGEALGQDLARARAARWSPIITPPPGCSRISTRSASTWSAMAAPPASAIPGRCPIRSPRRSRRAIWWSPAVLSGNRNFEGRISPHVRANYLASPPLVVAYALAGSMTIDLTTEPLGEGQRRQAGLSQGHLAVQPARSQTPSSQSLTAPNVPQALCQRVRGAGGVAARSRSTKGMTFDWDPGSTYVAHPPYFDDMPKTPGPLADISLARGRWRCSATASPPTTSRRRARSRRTARPAQYLHRASGAAGRFQFLRRAARPSRGDDARHLRQYPHQERDGAGRRRRRHQAPARRHGDADLRRRHAIPERGRAAGHRRRQGIRHRLVARLGGQGHAAAGRARR